MKIVEMHIYGYGQLENVKINSLNDFQVFFGENETGKSTIMAFIHGILFGFPTKQQTSELRYEPKHNAKYGGKIRIYHDELGYAVIERVKGKAAGDVRVSLENGTLGGEELLKELLANFDKSLVQAIFSFNLHGLQNIHQMKGEELGKFLFSAGTLGTEQLAKSETVLQKELESRFKPTGKKPHLNEKLQALHEINGELKKAAAKNKEYENLIEKKEMLEQEIIDVTGQLQGIQDKVEKLIEWKKIQSLVREEKWTKKEIGDLGQIQFPARGIERITKLNQLIHPYNAQILSLAERIENLKKELAMVKPDHSFLENEQAILTSLDQVPLYEQLMLEKQRCETKLIEIEKKLSSITEGLHLSLLEEEILTINTNIYMKNQVETVSRKSQKLLEVKEELEERYQEEKNSLEDIEKEFLLAERKVISAEERGRLEEKVNNRNNKKSLEVELNVLQDKIEFYHQANERDQAANVRLQKQKRVQFFTFELILVALTLYGFLTRQWMLLIFGIICCIVICLFMTKNLRQPKEKDITQMLEVLREKEKQLIQKLQSTEYRNISVLEEQLKLDNYQRERLQMLKIKLEQQQIQFDKIISKFEEWEKEAAINKEKLLSISSELKIPEYMANSYLLESFQLIEQYKSVAKEKIQLIEVLEQISLTQLKIVEELKVYANQYLPEKGLDLHKSVYLLRNKLKEEHQKQIKSNEKREKLADLEDDMLQITQEHKHVKVEYNKLLSSANVDNEQQFYELGNKAEKQVKLNERLEDIERQLQYSLLNESERDSFLEIHYCDELITECNDRTQALKAGVFKLQEQQAAIKYEIQVLEEGGVYSELLHQYKQKKFELEEEAKEWAKYCLAQDLLSRTIEKYKNVHLPRMLSKAEEYLSFLTNGSYNKIHLQKAGSGFLVERKDHTLFEANELSQATTEQLYVSIRLSLATTLYEKYQFPIIIDDSFVNFDGGRTKRMIELLKRLDRNQILFFTCHSHVLEHFQHDQILHVNKGTAQILS